MREWLLVFFSIMFVLSLFLNWVVAIALIPSMLLSYWVWKDEEEIEWLTTQVSALFSDKEDRKK